MGFARGCGGVSGQCRWGYSSNTRRCGRSRSRRGGHGANPARHTQPLGCTKSCSGFRLGGGNSHEFCPGGFYFLLCRPITFWISSPLGYAVLP